MSQSSNFQGDRSPAIDLTALASHTMNDADLQIEVLQLFFDQCATLMNLLSDHQDDRQWYEAAHALKGGARGVGLLPLGLLAEEAESLVGPTNDMKRRGHFHLILSELERARGAVKAHFAIEV